jgi:hypothetical protein
MTGPDIAPMKFNSRREAKDWCKAHHPGSPITEIGPGGKRAAPKKAPARPGPVKREALGATGFGRKSAHFASARRRKKSPAGGRG